MSEKKRINLSVTKELYDRVYRISNRMGISMSSYCVMNIATSLDAYEQLINNIANNASQEIKKLDDDQIEK